MGLGIGSKKRDCSGKICNEPIEESHLKKKYIKNGVSLDHDWEMFEFLWTMIRNCLIVFLRERGETKST